MLLGLVEQGKVDEFRMTDTLCPEYLPNMPWKEIVEQFFKAKFCTSSVHWYPVQWRGKSLHYYPFNVEKYSSNLTDCSIERFCSICHPTQLIKKSKYISYELDIFPQAKITQNKNYSFCFLSFYEKSSYIASFLHFDHRW